MWDRRFRLSTRRSLGTSIAVFFEKARAFSRKLGKRIPDPRHVRKPEFARLPRQRPEFRYRPAAALDDDDRPCGGIPNQLRSARVTVTDRGSFQLSVADLDLRAYTL